LQAANGSRISIFGTLFLTVDLGLRRDFPSVFTIAHVPTPLLGADFLQHFGITIDCQKRVLRDNMTAALGAPVKHTVMHYIETTCPPVHARPRRLAPDSFKPAKAEFEHMMRLGIVEPSDSEFASPLHMVLKKDQDWRRVANIAQLTPLLSLTVILYIYYKTSRPRCMGKPLFQNGSGLCISSDPN